MSEKDERPIAEDSTPDQEKHRHRMRHDWHDLIEDLIAEGRDAGLFDNLPGAGKPLAYRKNPFAPELDIAHSLLKENDMAPAWIGERRRLLQQTAALRETIARRWQYYERAYRTAHTATRRYQLVMNWDDTCRRWQTEITTLNKAAEKYNLKRPLESMELFKLSLSAELKRAGARRHL